MTFGLHEYFRVLYTSEKSLSPSLPYRTPGLHGWFSTLLLSPLMKYPYCGMLIRGMLASDSFVVSGVQVLSDPEQRMVYDEINGYALTSANPFLNYSARERDHAFVDEFTCIGKFLLSD